MVEEEVEELSLLLVDDDEGRERARNLTTDLLLYLKSQLYKLQILWNMTDLVGHMRTASFLDEPK